MHLKRAAKTALKPLVRCATRSRAACDVTGYIWIRGVSFGQRAYDAWDAAEVRHGEARSSQGPPEEILLLRAGDFRPDRRDDATPATPIFTARPSVGLSGSR
ncbi:hypothetical protein PMIN03_000451 [Paraphaeosphaeria minitans]